MTSYKREVNAPYTHPYFWQNSFLWQILEKKTILQVYFRLFTSNNGSASQERCFPYAHCHTTLYNEFPEITTDLFLKSLKSH